MPAYLRLCRDTWTRNCPEFRITLLNYDNFEHYTGAGVLDVETLKTVSLPSQKDAIMFAVLAKCGGIFMDMDTIVFSGLADIQQRLDRTELLTFHMHLGILAARPQSTVVLECLKGVQQKLALLRKQPQPSTQIAWDFLGNSVLNEVVWKAAHRMSLVSRMQGAILGGLSRLLSRTGKMGMAPARFFAKLDRFIATQVIFRHAFRQYYLILSRDRQGFIAERIYGDLNIHDPRQKYLDYWFASEPQFGREPPRQVPVIGLHNSWTPQWYSSLSESEVLENDCLLSRTLREALNTSSSA